MINHPCIACELGCPLANALYRVHDASGIMEDADLVDGSYFLCTADEYGPITERVERIIVELTAALDRTMGSPEHQVDLVLAAAGLL